jgi:hypothetical protein
VDFSGGYEIYAPLADQLKSLDIGVLSKCRCDTRQQVNVFVTPVMQSTMSGSVTNILTLWEMCRPR